MKPSGVILLLAIVGGCAFYGDHFAEIYRVHQITSSGKSIQGQVIASGNQPTYGLFGFPQIMKDKKTDHFYNDVAFKDDNGIQRTFRDWRADTTYKPGTVVPVIFDTTNPADAIIDIKK